MKPYKYKQISLTVLLMSLTLTLLAGCGTAKGEVSAGAASEDKVLQYQSSPGSVSFPELAEDLGYFGDITLEKVSNSVGGPESIQLTATGDTDFGAAFNGAIVKAVSRNVKIKSVVGSYGSDKHTYIGAYALETSGIEEPKDFIGKQVGMNILGAHAEFVVKDYLRKGGLTEDEISQVVLVTMPAGTMEQTLRNNQLDIAILSGISRDRALEGGGLVELFKDIEVFGSEFTAGDYFFTEDYIKKNPTTVKTFVDGVAKAIEWARETPREEVIARFEAIVKKREGNESIDNLKYWQSTGIAQTGGVITEDEYSVWIDWLVKTGELKEGQVKAEDLYTNEFNLYAK